MRWMLVLLMPLVLSACASEARLMDAGVRPTDLPECALSSARPPARQGRGQGLEDPAERCQPRQEIGVSFGHDARSDDTFKLDVLKRD